MIVGHVMINIVQIFFTGHQQHTNRKLHVQKNSYPLSRQTDRHLQIPGSSNRLPTFYYMYMYMYKHVTQIEAAHK